MIGTGTDGGLPEFCVCARRSPTPLRSSLSVTNPAGTAPPSVPVIHSKQFPVPYYCS